eukprot:6388333-Lingulodinium_polyedra.AAC.1
MAQVPQIAVRLAHGRRLQHARTCVKVDALIELLSGPRLAKKAAQKGAPSAPPCSALPPPRHQHQQALLATGKWPTRA